MTVSSNCKWFNHIGSFTREVSEARRENRLEENNKFLLVLCLATKDYWRQRTKEFIKRQGMRTKYNITNFTATWLGLEDITLSEINQSQKEK